MPRDYGELLTDPGAFFDRTESDSSVLVPTAVVLVVGALSAASAWITFQNQRAFFEGVAQDAGGSTEMAGQIFAAAGAVSVVFAFVAALLAWLYYGAFIMGVSALVDGEGSFKSVMVVVAWGFVPKVFEVLIKAVGNWYLTIAVEFPEEATQQSLQNYQQTLQSHPVNVLMTLVGIGALLWSAYIWYEGVQRSRRLDAREALLAVGFPAGIILLTRLWSLLSALT